MTYQKARPTIALCMIVKNERENLPRLLDSVAGCFDEIHITDTGSTDGTIAYLEALAKQAPAAGPAASIHLHHFEWINDFAAARNFAFSHPKTDFLMWLDGDDELGNPAAFRLWRDTAMELSDFWVVPYHYAFVGGRSICSFARERVVRREKGFKWRYFIHEGIDIRSGWGEIRQNGVNTWCVNHRRTDADIQKDRSRNIKIFEKQAASGAKLDGRMIYYWGKELFENGQPMEAFQKLMEASQLPDGELELHDRVMALQYASNAAQACQQFDKSIAIALQGLHLWPTRPEFHVLIADAMTKLNRLADAIPFYCAARECGFAHHGGTSPLFSNPETSETWPTLQLARVWANLGNFKKAQEYAAEACVKWPSEEARAILKQCEEALEVIECGKADPAKLEKTDDIVILCPPTGAYPWDEEIYGKKGIGGSETAAVEMSRWLAKLTGRKVLIFNNTEQVRNFPSGVEYRNATRALDYFRRYLPAVCINWRHTQRMTPAPTYIWCHDLITPGLEAGDYTKAICLSEFSKRYTMTTQGVAEEKIQVSRNGINPDRFRGWKVEKKPHKVIFPSSPDRGLDRAMRIIDKARETLPELELHVFYGMDNLEKYGQGALAARLREMIAARPWVKYHGNVQQDVLAREMAESSVWLYPANFIETFCITAIEALASGVFPLAREMGALQNTLREAHENRQALLLNLDAETELQVDTWADHLVKIIRSKAWENVKIDLDRVSWESVAREWCKWLSLSIQSSPPSRS